MGRKSIIDELAKIRYPARAVTAAQDWNIEIEQAARRLYDAARKNQLHRDGGTFIPTPETLRIWKENGYY